MVIEAMQKGKVKAGRAYGLNTVLMAANKIAARAELAVERTKVSLPGIVTIPAKQ
jgi:hypothetical protein